LIHESKATFRIRSSQFRAGWIQAFGLDGSSRESWNASS